MKNFLTIEQKNELLNQHKKEKDNMICKNRDKDRFLTKLRCPFESVFSQDNKRVRYRGLD